MASFNPSPTESSILAQVIQKESSGNYTAQISPADCAKWGMSVCTASGAYGFIDSTWQMAAQATGVGTQYTSAYQAPAWMQDTNALWLLRYAGGDPNASAAWGASGPYDTTAVGPGDGTPLIDLSGAAANTPTSDIMSQLDTTAASLIPGMDFSGAGILLVLGAAVLVYLAVGRR